MWQIKIILFSQLRNNSLLILNFVLEKVQFFQYIVISSIKQLMQKNNVKSTTLQTKPVKPMSMPKPSIKIVKKQEELPAKKTGFTEFPSAKLANIKTVDPFAQKKGNSFSHLYSSGAIPCKIEHGSSSMKIKWNSNVTISQLPYNPLLVTCFEGLIEEKHPYGFIAYNVCKQMILDEESAGKLIDLLPKIVWSLRTALSHKNQTICSNALQILRLLSDKVGNHLNAHLKNLLTPIKKHMTDKKLKQKAIITLRSLQDNGGPEVNKIIKTAIPIYSNS